MHLGANLAEELAVCHYCLLKPSSIAQATCYVTGEHLASIGPKESLQAKNK